MNKTLRILFGGLGVLLIVLGSGLLTTPGDKAFPALLLTIGCLLFVILANGLKKPLYLLVIPAIALPSSLLQLLTSKPIRTTFGVAWVIAAFITTGYVDRYYKRKSTHNQAL